MILGQLIQMGRRFCECRSQDFIPESDERVIVLAYTINDMFLAQSFDTDDPVVKDRIRDWLERNRAIAYLLVTRHFNDAQEEFPAPVGRPLIERLSIAAATTDSFSYATFLMETRLDQKATKLVSTAAARDLPDVARTNIFQTWLDEDQLELPERERFTFDLLANAR